MGGSSDTAPVEVDGVTVNGSEATANLAGNALVNNTANGITLDGDTVNVNAKSETSGITSAKVVIPAATADALNGKTVIVETNVGSINGIYIATATPHYKHPTTGVIEDSGGDGSAVLGQSMTESATYKKALVEVDPQGNTYITIRLQLMDNIQNPSFQVDGKSVTADIMQENWGSSSTDTMDASYDGI